MTFSADDWFTLTVPADLRVLSLVRVTVDGIARLAGFTEADAYSLKLAAVEACANSILHGYRSRPARPLSLACRVVAGGLEIRLRDQGEPFDISAAALPNPTDL